MDRSLYQGGYEHGIKKRRKGPEGTRMKFSHPSGGLLRQREVEKIQKLDQNKEAKNKTSSTYYWKRRHEMKTKKE